MGGTQKCTQTSTRYLSQEAATTLDPSWSLTEIRYPCNSTTCIMILKESPFVAKFQHSFHQALCGSSVSKTGDVMTQWSLSVITHAAWRQKRIKGRTAVETSLDPRTATANTRHFCHYYMINGEICNSNDPFWHTEETNKCCKVRT